MPRIERDEKGRFVKGHICLTKKADFCSIQNCSKKYYAKGLCATHYVRLNYSPRKNLNAHISIGKLPPLNLGRLSEETKPQSHPSLYDIYWAAGIWEGEGSYDGNTVQVYQDDKWILNRLKDLFGGKVHQRKKIRRFGKNIQYAWYLCGARSRGFIMTIYSLLSPKKQEKVKNFWISRNLMNPAYIKNLLNLRKNYANNFIL